MFFSPLYDSWHKTGIFLFSLGKPMPMSCQWEQNHCLGCYQAELYPVASKSYNDGTPEENGGGGNLDCFQSQNSILRLSNEGGLSDSFQGGPGAPERNAAWWAGVKYQLTVLLGTRAGPSIKYHFRKKTYLPTCWQFISRWGLTPAPRAVTSIFPLWNCRQLVCGGSARPINIYTFYSHCSQSI